MNKTLTLIVLFLFASVADAATLYRARMMMGTACAPANMTEIMFEFQSGQCALFKADGPLKDILPSDLGITFTVHTLDQIDITVSLLQCGGFLGITVPSQKGTCKSASLLGFALSATLLDSYVVNDPPEPTLSPGDTPDPGSKVVIDGLRLAVGYFDAGVDACGTSQPLPTYTVDHGSCVMQQNVSMVGEVYGKVECFGSHARYSASLYNNCSEVTDYQGYPVSLPFNEVIPVGDVCVEGFLKIGADTTTSTSVVMPFYVSVSSCVGVIDIPTAAPTNVPTIAPTLVPTGVPTGVPTNKPAPPTVVPTAVPTEVPTTTPTMTPGVPPTVAPTAVPTAVPTTTPTLTPGVTVAPTGVPAKTTLAPTVPPTIVPTMTPGVPPTTVPTMTPGVPPTIAPTAVPTGVPTIVPTMTPGVPPTTVPTMGPGVPPTIVPTMTPGVPPTSMPTMAPSTTLSPFKPAAVSESNGIGTFAVIAIVVGSLLVILVLLAIVFVKGKPPASNGAEAFDLEKQILENANAEQLEVMEINADTVAE
eukprot:TRINITY_DN11779_c0_g1_i1.p1 TRINITY_DN11779_c0_g1~~TRINITY_DN11779_c0_g1_i1.p1  ORF type:complete len:551 (+),score=117.03 TRINITY_DN11779_c0_g1_i1:63-1655(+)